MHTSKRVTVNGTKKKRCPNDYRRDKKTDKCVNYKGIQVFKDMKSQIITDKPTLSLESLDKGAILKIYNDGKLINQQYIDEKVLQKSKIIEEKGSKYIFKMIRKIQKDPTIIKKDNKFMRFQKKMVHKKGGNNQEGSQYEEPMDILVQEDVMDKLQSTKIQKLKDKLALLEGELKEEVDLYYNSWANFNGILGIMNVVGTVGDAIFGGCANCLPYFQDSIITTGLLSSLIVFITNMVAFSVSSEMINTIQTIVTYIVFTLSFSVMAVIFTSFSGIAVIQDSLWIADFVAIFIKNYIISTREKSTKEIKLEKDIADIKSELVKAMEE